MARQVWQPLSALAPGTSLWGEGPLPFPNMRRVPALPGYPPRKKKALPSSSFLQSLQMTGILNLKKGFFCTKQDDEQILAA